MLASVPKPALTEAAAPGTRHNSAHLPARLAAGKLRGALVDRVEVGGLGAFGSLHSLEEVARFWGESAPIDETLTQLDALRDAIVRIASDQAKPVEP